MYKSTNERFTNLQGNWKNLRLRIQREKKSKEYDKKKPYLAQKVFRGSKWWRIRKTNDGYHIHINMVPFETDAEEKSVTFFLLWSFLSPFFLLPFFGHNPFQCRPVYELGEDVVGMCLQIHLSMDTTTVSKRKWRYDVCLLPFLFSLFSITHFIIVSSVFISIFSFYVDSLFPLCHSVFFCFLLRPRKASTSFSLPSLSFSTSNYYEIILAIEIQIFFFQSFGETYFTFVPRGYK